MSNRDPFGWLAAALYVAALIGVLSVVLVSCGYPVPWFEVKA